MILILNKLSIDQIEERRIKLLSVVSKSESIDMEELMLAKIRIEARKTKLLEFQNQFL
jgi:hypothetical protein